MKLVLYTGTKNASSWSMRAWLAMREQELRFEERSVDIRRPQRFENLADIALFSPPGAVPVLLVDGSVIFDSLAIMEFANELGAHFLMPEDLLERARARSLLAWQHSGLSNVCPRLSFESAFYPEKRLLIESEQEDIRFLFSIWENHLHGSGGPYLFGAITLVDLIFVPTVLRLFRHLPDFSPFPLVQAWGDRLLQRASVQEWLLEADRLEHVWDDDYLSFDSHPSTIPQSTYA